MHSAAKQYTPVLAVAVLLVATVVLANGPELTPTTRLPGMSEEKSLEAIVKAAAGAEDLVSRHGKSVGVTDASQLSHQGRQCLLWFKLLGAVQGFPAAEQMATEAVKRWCGGPDLRALRIMGAALKEHQSLSRQGLALTEQQRQLLLEAAKWAAVGGAVLLSAPSLALP